MESSYKAHNLQKEPKAHKASILKTYEQDVKLLVMTWWFVRTWDGTSSCIIKGILTDVE